MMRLLVTCLTVTLLLSFTVAASAQVKLSKKEEAAALSQAARGKFKEGRFTVCAAMYREAFGMDRSQIGYLYSAALCEQKANNFVAAERDYRTVLGLVGPENPLASKSRKHIDEVRGALIQKQRQDAERRRQARLQKQRADAAARAKRAADAKKKADAKNAALAGQIKQGAKPKNATAGWGSIAGGVIAAGLGGFLLMDGMSDIESLQADLQKTDGAGLINGVSRDDAQSRQDAANTKQQLGGAVLAVGVGVAAFGAWLLAPPAPPKKPKAATLAPTLDRPGFVATFRF